MSSKIRILSENIINQIAAGEVIVDPTSVIKELVENAIDAKAKNIHVVIRGGGFLSLQVVDDGIGMSKYDAILCLERHATSKIQTLSDLSSLITLGFRGEALSSIGAISHMEIETREEISPMGTKIIFKGGKLINVSSIARNPGTTLSVLSLFYNVPARKKSQKSHTQSTREISQMVNSLALSHPHIVFSLSSNSIRLLSTTHNKQRRIEEVLGEKFLYNTTSVHYSLKKYHIHGIIGLPDNMQRNRSYQYLIINYRFVISTLIEEAIQRGLGTHISPNKGHSLFVLWFHLPYDHVDVNVHPQKKEVRFLENKQVLEFIQNSIEYTLFRKNNPPLQVEGNSLEKSINWHQISNKFCDISPEKHSLPPLNSEKESSKKIEQWHPSTTPLLLCKEKSREMTILGIIDSFALIQRAEIFSIMDIKEADSLIQFHYFLEELQLCNTKKREQQSIFFPEVLSVSTEEATVLSSHLEVLQMIGLGIRPFGRNNFIIDALPPLLSIDQAKIILLKISQRIELNQKLSIKDMAKMIATMSVLQKRSYSTDDVKYLYHKIAEKNDVYSLRGTKIIKNLSKENLKNWIRDKK